MDKIYQKIIEKIMESGERLRKKAGKIQDIGITKKYLTEEDIRIERELKQIIHEFNPQHGFYAEEENEKFSDAEDIWIADPISGTNAFIIGLPQYGIVVAYSHNGKIQFAVVYNPSFNDLYTAHRNKGAYLNGQKISIKEAVPEKPRIIFNLSSSWKDVISARRIFYELSSFELYRLFGFHALSNCLVALGKYDGVVCLTKDSFPYFASSLIIKEAGGIFTNIDGEEDIKPSDRIFIGGNKIIYPK